MVEDRRSGRKRRSNKHRRYIAGKRSCLIVTTAFLAVLLVILLLVAIKGFGRKTPDKLAGVWIYDQYTQYEFDGFGSGCMHLDSQMNLDFTYVIRGESLSFDFAADYVQDCKYTFSISNGEVTLIAGEGTSQVGTVYKLTRKVDER